MESMIRFESQHDLPFPPEAVWPALKQYGLDESLARAPSGPL